MLDADVSHVLSLYAETPTTSRRLGTFDVPRDHIGDVEVTTWLNAGERVRWLVPTMLRIGGPYGLRSVDQKYRGTGFGIESFEAEGPLFEPWPPASHTRLLGDLPLTKVPKPPTGAPPLVVVSEKPAEDAERLLQAFLPRAFRRRVEPLELQRYTAIANDHLKDGDPFHVALLAAYKAALCSPDFLYLHEPAGSSTTTPWPPGCRTFSGGPRRTTRC